MTREEMELLLGDISHLEKQRALASCQLEADRLLHIYLHATRHAETRRGGKYAAAATRGSSSRTPPPVSSQDSSQIDDDVAFMVTTNALFD
jgi:hypothetical protein